MPSLLLGMPSIRILYLNSSRPEASSPFCGPLRSRCSKLSCVPVATIIFKVVSPELRPKTRYHISKRVNITLHGIEAGVNAWLEECPTFSQSSGIQQIVPCQPCDREFTSDVLITSKHARDKISSGLGTDRLIVSKLQSSGQATVANAHRVRRPSELASLFIS